MTPKTETRPTTDRVFAVTYNGSEVYLVRAATRKAAYDWFSARYLSAEKATPTQLVTLTKQGVEVQGVNETE